MKRLLWLMIFALAVAGSVSAQTPTPTPTYQGTVTSADRLNEVQVSRTVTTGSLTLKVRGPAAVLEVRVHLNAAGTTQTLTVSLENSTNSAHDVLLASQSMESTTDFVWRPDSWAVLPRDDTLAVEWGNAGAKTVGATVIWRLR